MSWLHILNCLDYQHIRFSVIYKQESLVVEMHILLYGYDIGYNFAYGLGYKVLAIIIRVLMINTLPRLPIGKDLACKQNHHLLMSRV